MSFIECRKKAGLKRKDAANLIGVCYQTMCKWEHNHSCPYSEKLPSIAAVYGCTVEELMDGMSFKPRQPYHKYDTLDAKRAARAASARKYQQSHKAKTAAYLKERRDFVNSKPYFYEVKGKPFRDARERKGVSMNAAGRAIGVAAAQIWNWEHGYCSPTPEHLKQIADYYGVEPDSLLV